MDSHDRPSTPRNRWHSEVLHQDREWYDLYSRVHLLAEMPSDYLRAVIRFLEASATQRAAQEFEWRIERVDETGERVQVLDIDLITDSIAWIRRTPLVRGLYTALARRGEPLEPEPPRCERFTFANGDTVLTHTGADCVPSCPFHAPSAHPLSSAPLLLPRSGLPVRVCAHNVSHPDVDALAEIARLYGQEYAVMEGVHACDGCCKAAAGDVAADTRGEERS